MKAAELSSSCPTRRRGGARGTAASRTRPRAASASRASSAGGGAASTRREASRGTPVPFRDRGVEVHVRGREFLTNAERLADVDDVPAAVDRVVVRPEDDSSDFMAELPDVSDVFGETRTSLIARRHQIHFRVARRGARELYDVSVSVRGRVRHWTEDVGQDELERAAQLKRLR
eukprot:30068-Pelagococcus_subviridis.AAC.5